MKKINITALLVLPVLCLIGQEPVFEWAKQMGGETSPEQGRSITTDDIGNVYITGHFFETADFDPGSDIYNLSSSGGWDIFVSKLDADGNFIWAKAMGGTDTNISLAIALDNFGNVYTSGYFNGTVDFDPGPNIFNISSSGANDIFISKLDVDGNFVWVKTMGGTSVDRSHYIAVDGTGNVYTTGYFNDTADFDPGPDTYNLTSTSLWVQSFISKLDADGNFVWAKSFEGNLENIGNSIVIDGLGNVYTTGGFTGLVDFDPGSGTFNLTSDMSEDVFVSKLDTDGNFIWAKSMGGASTSSGNSIAIDNLGNIYIAGVFSDTADFDPGPDTYIFSSMGERDIFILKLGTEGNFIWANAMGGIDSDICYSIDVDDYGNVYSTGWFADEVDFDPGPDNFNLNASGFLDIFISKLDTDGNFVWAGKLSGGGSNLSTSITLDDLGNIYTTGHFVFTVDFDPGQNGFNITSFGGIDVFVHKMSQCLLKANISSEDGFEICEGESLTLTANPGMNYAWSSGDTTATILVFPAITTIYTVTVSESSSNCSDIDTVTIVVNELPEFSISGDTEVCEGESTILSVNEGENYSWSTGETSSAILISPLITSDFSVTVTDSIGCTNSDSVTVIVNRLPNIDISGELEVCPGDTIILTANGGVDYSWSTGNNAAAIELYPLSSEVYAVTVTDENDCSNTESVNIAVNDEYCPPCVTFAVPNVFTPNGDQQNDYFHVFADGAIKITDFRIYSRWGTLVHQSAEPWDGTFKGEPLPSDVYIYMITLETNCGIKQLNGDVSLIR